MLGRTFGQCIIPALHLESLETALHALWELKAMWQDVFNQYLGKEPPTYSQTPPPSTTNLWCSTLIQQRCKTGSFNLEENRFFLQLYRRILSFNSRIELRLSIHFLKSNHDYQHCVEAVFKEFIPIYWSTPGGICIAGVSWSLSSSHQILWCTIVRSEIFVLTYFTLTHSKKGDRVGFMWLKLVNGLCPRSHLKMISDWKEIHLD